MKTTDIGFERFEEDFYADSKTMFIKSNNEVLRGKFMSKPRLIDANVITKEKLIKQVGDQQFISFDDLLEMLEDIPTAYDIDSVVAQLEEESWSVRCSFAPKENRTAIIKTERAIEIVKQEIKYE